MAEPGWWTRNFGEKYELPGVRIVTILLIAGGLLVSIAAAFSGDWLFALSSLSLPVLLLARLYWERAALVRRSRLDDRR